MDKNTQQGFYLLSSKHPHRTTGTNRVDFAIRGNRININHAGWRKASAWELAFLHSKLLADGRAR